MALLQALLYLAAIALLILAAFGVPSRVSFALLGAARALAGFAAPAIAAGF